LRRGIFLRLAPERSQVRTGPSAVTEASLEVFWDKTDKQGSRRWRTIKKWNDNEVYRARLLAVQFRLPKGVNNGGTIHLTQLSDAWLRLPGKQGMLEIGLPPFTGPLKEEKLASRGWETRPLFGTYFLQVEDDFVKNADQLNFRAEVHFLAAGLTVSD